MESQDIEENFDSTEPCSIEDDVCFTFSFCVRYFFGGYVIA